MIMAPHPTALDIPLSLQSSALRVAFCSLLLPTSLPIAENLQATSLIVERLCTFPPNILFDREGPPLCLPFGRA